MTIYDIKARVKDEPYFFSRNNMKCFGQTMKMFSVRKYNSGYILTCPMRDRYNKFRVIGETVRYYNPVTFKFCKASEL